MKMICIGRNYTEHALELNNPLPTEPVFFMKPESALLRNNLPFFYPSFSNDIHYEVELVLHVCKVGRQIDPKFAHTYFDAIGIGIDFTARDLQQKAKEKGLPWEIAKAFDASAPVSQFIPVGEFSDLKNINFGLELNGEIVQQGNSSAMIFDFAAIISYVSNFVTLKQNDFIFTGTPSGVGPVKIGDRLEAFIGDRKLLLCNIR
ncbi:MAG: fumarylacetoacetate hydrolase family protein [Lentimicrobium sp.]|jgi:2-keto-4-pentenoate hydratase/2-oxohepta-3-ene-1,7-dioic acid hydratase in catechol pathway|nr:fumarylacetoacetate hydrolase family protein [Lentimicrobium sp.]MDD2528820.1 fumarylacetoacetate hydrolase family protein [Lentimicrobiaceae bacterium]MDD4597788.1 fumarylacetoacetate hydrolase family protein [Lentimicrobiaceae bacterium]MDY0025469.1 fumarylacetoacetate hydrolase family protein [Lentimicrobium sp.]HAH58822.1 2-hydroxyhepta-2,4-diene-1,7-dioate isomerase [Bacteroidales bacterium]